MRHAGKLGTGLTHATPRDPAGKPTGLRRDTPPLADETSDHSATSVEPQLVAQVGLGEWTRDGRLRHPRLLGPRDDKPASDIVRETDESTGSRR